MVSKNLPSGNNAFMKSFKNWNEKSEVEYKIQNTVLSQSKNLPQNMFFLSYS